MALSRAVALHAFFAWGALGGLLALSTVAAPSPRDLAGVFPWALFLSGVAAVALLAPHAASDARPWALRVLRLLPVATAAFLLHEALPHALAVAAGDLGRSAHALAMHVALLAGLALALVARRHAFASWRAALREGWPLLVAAPIPLAGPFLGLIAIALNGALVLAVARPQADAQPALVPAPA